ncbi:uncharacterized protein LOC116016082 [Ipomoea triloba]|uniref:uncharacterized protein LOC116016082 n=1 Tax=Ipomoea triloba TaxID=35885 RepID=UPI00125CDC55|nr:uncharacterized protein LOC116016082 [Ipomoea triloba]
MTSIALYDEDKIFFITDEKYVEELQMQDALMSSAAKTQTPGRQAKAGGEIFRSDSCRHSYCSECIDRHVAAKIQENISVFKFPDVSCKGIIEPQHCRSIIPTYVFERWESALCESLILASQKFYRTYKDYSAMIVDDGSETLTAFEWPSCRRLFCA